MSIPSLRIGDLTITATRRLPQTAFTATSTKKQSFQRSQTGKLYTQRLYDKYSVRITGLAQDLYEDLRFEASKDSFTDLYSIANRKEVFSATGTTRMFLTTRRIRTDDNAALATVEHPAGTIVSGVSLSNPAGATQGHVIFTGLTPSAGTNNVVVRYFPIINGSIVELESDYSWTRDEETWSMVFEEA